MNKNELAAEIVRKGYTKKKVAEKLGIHRVTFMRKLNGHYEFTLKEIDDMVNILDIPDERIRPIFFDPKVE